MNFSFERNAETPPLEGHGLVLAAAAGVTAGQPVWIHGAFELPSQLERDLGVPLMRSVVLVGQLGELHFVDVPFAQALLFQDDEVAVLGARRGSFHCELFLRRGVTAPGRYLVHATMGDWMSNQLAIELTEGP
ncbi:MAG: hypothetical protein AAGA56_13770 [Myxococcota bacterium]